MPWGASWNEIHLGTAFFGELGDADMSGPMKGGRGCVAMVTGFLMGSVLGFVIGAAVVALLNWATREVERETAIRPLADLAIAKPSLTTEETKGYIDGLAQEYLHSGKNFAVSIGILKDGRSQVFGYGTLVAGENAPPDQDTVFEIASVGKTFTASVLADMHLQGEVNLDTPLEEILGPQVKLPRYQDQKITLLDLATQSSGLPSLPDNMTGSDPLNPYADYTVEQMYEALAKVELTRGIGREYGYSNLGFGLLGHALAIKAGTDYETLVVSRVCDPLHMNSTRMTLDKSLRSRLATPHDNGQPVPVWEDRTLAGAGSFLSTTGDMLKYVQAHWDGREGRPHEALRLAIKKRRPSHTPATAIGLGWHVDSENALDIVWHNGGSGGSRSYVAFLPEHKVGVVVLSNSTTPVDALGRKILYLLHEYWRP